MKKGEKNMNILLLAFALPVAIIILSIVLEKILKCPILVAATFFAILLIIAFAVFDSSFLVFVIIYTILAYITAVITRLICSIISRLNLNINCNCICSNDRDERERNNRREKNSNCNVSSGTWRCTTRSLPRSGISQISDNAISNNGMVCTCDNDSDDSSNSGNDPVIILTNANDIVNRDNDNRRDRRNGCNCRCGCNRR